MAEVGNSLSVQNERKRKKINPQPNGTQLEDHARAHVHLREYANVVIFLLALPPANTYVCIPAKLAVQSLRMNSSQWTCLFLWNFFRIRHSLGIFIKHVCWWSNSASFIARTQLHYGVGASKRKIYICGHVHWFVINKNKVIKLAYEKSDGPLAILISMRNLFIRIISALQCEELI